MYCSPGGRTDCTNAWDTSPLLGICLMLTAMEVRSQTSVWDSTGAKQSDFSQLWVSRFPKTTMRYLHRFGCPFSSRFSVDMAIVGSAGPVTFFRTLYSSSVITSNAGRWRRPSYSSL